MLNKNQMKAVMHTTGPFLCVAGPGSGKTTVIMHRIKNLVEVEKVDPFRIMVVTFTKAAADEMNKRYIALTSRNDPISFSTIHSFCFNVIRQEAGYTAGNILGEEVKSGFIKNYLKNNIKIDPMEIEEKAKGISNEISIIKMSRLDLCFDNVESDNIKKKDLIALYLAYEGYKTEEGKIDYDDMILICAELLNDKFILSKLQGLFDYIMVDEFQDTDPVQSEIIYKLAEKHRNLFIVGDDDQSIYKFRGAEPKIMLDFPVSFPEAKTVYLDVNYRSMTEIIDHAKSLIEYNSIRFNKNIRGNKTELGSVNSFILENENTFQEKLLQEIANSQITKDYNEMAILCRTNSEVSLIAGFLSNADIPFQCTETIKNVHTEFVFKDIISYLKIALEKDTTDDLINIANKPKRYLSKDMCISTNCDIRRMKNYISDNFDDKKRVMGFRNVYKFEDDIKSIKIMKNATPIKFVNYILNIMGYRNYMEEYCEFLCSDIQKATDIVAYMKDECSKFTTLTEWYNYIQRYDIKFAEYAKEKSKSKNGVTISTMHRSKGLEWDQVFVTGIAKGNIPYERKGRKTEEEEERRLLYVAITRARKSCTLFAVDRTGNNLSKFHAEVFSGKRKERRKA